LNYSITTHKHTHDLLPAAEGQSIEDIGAHDQSRWSGEEVRAQEHYVKPSEQCKLNQVLHRMGVRVLCGVLQVDRALKTLSRMVRAGGILKEWKAQEHNVKPAEQRVLDAKESARRKSKKLFKRQMAAIAIRQGQ